MVSTYVSARRSVVQSSYEGLEILETENENRQKVLIVDDERQNRLALSNVLEDRYQLILAKNGEQALDKARRHIPDLILLDVIMPGMDGYEVYERLQADPELRHMAVIFITALDSNDDEERGLSLGAWDYVKKPFNPGIVLRRIGNACAMIRQVSELRAALEQVKTLEGLLPICSYCKRIRDDADTWTGLERYVSDRANVKFSHSICPSCYSEHYPDDE